MATYTYSGEPLTFPTVRLSDGSQLVAEPGQTYDLAEEINDPRFTSAGSSAAVTSITDSPATTGGDAEPAVTPQASETGLDSSETPSTDQGA